MRQKAMVLGMLLMLATLLLYSQVVHHEFLSFDDNPYVTNNPHVNTGLHRDNIVWAFTSFHQANWHPLTWISHMVDCQLFGLNAGWHHLVNVVLHGVNVLLLFLLLERATGALWRSFFVAAVFAVHPLNVETVAWVAQRKSLLSAFFSFLAIGAYGWYVQRPGRQRYLLVVVAFALALLSKPMAVSLPLVLLFLDYWPLERDKGFPRRARWYQLTIEKLPLFLMSVMSSWVTVVAQRAGGAMAEEEALPFALRIKNAIVSYVAYIGKALWPTKLAVFYVHPEGSLTWGVIFASAMILVAITVGVIYFRRERYLAVGWFLYIATLVPVIGILQVGRQGMADRYAYIPCIGLYIIAAWGLGRLVEGAGIPRVIAVAGAAGVLSALSAGTFNYLQYWQNGVSLFTRASAIAGRTDFIIEEGLGDELIVAGRYDEAFEHFQQSCRLNPDYPLCHYNLAGILVQRGRLQSALEQYQLAGEHSNRKDLTLSCLTQSAQILLRLGDYRTAEVAISAALRIDPKNTDALHLRGMLQQESPPSH